MNYGSDISKVDLCLPVNVTLWLHRKLTAYLRHQISMIDAVTAILGQYLLSESLRLVCLEIEVFFLP